jgi:L-threonylcarbamoyladenylate synthase
MNTEIKKAIEILNNGETLLYPTDTVWGIGCDATNESAVEKIYDIKGREKGKSMIVLVSSEILIERYVEDVPNIVWELIDVTDKPLTIIYPKAKNLPKNLVHENGSIAIRLVKDGFCGRLLQQFRKPIVSTSANISGKSTPATINEVSEQIKNKVNYIIDPDIISKSSNKSSSIISIGESGEIKIIRE